MSHQLTSPRKSNNTNKGQYKKEFSKCNDHSDDCTQLQEFRLGFLTVYSWPLHESGQWPSEPLIGTDYW